MTLVNLNHAAEVVDFHTAVRRGLGQKQGLYFPTHIQPLADMDSLMAMDYHSLCTRVLGELIGPDAPRETIAEIVASAFDFPLRLTPVSASITALELFHGPSLAFKDFGARFMARWLGRHGGGEPLTILTATSGDTGAAVAHAFLGVDNVRVVILYPADGVSPLQEKLFCTLGGNIETLAVNNDFDACQALVRQAFDDQDLARQLGLNSANSINVARLYAQVCYYFEAFRREGLSPKTVCVPSGNFGNVTAALIGRRLGLPISKVIAATNENDTVPRFLATGDWAPQPTVSTISNAMDISRPNNFTRVLKLASDHGQTLNQALQSQRISQQENIDAIRDLYQQGYLADPHSALAYAALERNLTAAEQGMFLCTAHPAKFKQTLENCLGIELQLPEELAAVADKQVLSGNIPADFSRLKAYLLQSH